MHHSQIRSMAPYRPPFKRYRILRFGAQRERLPMNTHCRIGRITPTERGLRCREFMAWLFNRPLQSPSDWTMSRFMRVE
jgi:hypothetical protein